jgi:hypothetical protein
MRYLRLACRLHHLRVVLNQTCSNASLHASLPTITNQSWLADAKILPVFTPAPGAEG